MKSALSRGHVRHDAVEISSLVLEGSPRLDGEVTDHIHLLVESEAPLPPILVHRQTMRVLDGMHRVRAATLRGERTIAADFFDGSEIEAFMAAVKANVTHGLPLTAADREAAAERIIRSQPMYSNRAIAAIAGLSTKTVAAVRQRIGTDEALATARLGRDGRFRPLNSAEARRMASEVIAENPEASLRKIAQVVGLSPATVRDVRERMKRGDDPVPAGQRESAAAPQARPEADDASRDAAERRTQPIQPSVRDRAMLLRNLNRDPSLRFSESGRSFLRWLFSKATGPEGWEEFTGIMPVHCAYLVAEVARGCALEWLDLADRLERELDDTA